MAGGGGQILKLLRYVAQESWSLPLSHSRCPVYLTPLYTVKGITSTSYFSVHFKNTTFWMIEGKFLCSGDSLGLADLSDKAN